MDLLGVLMVLTFCYAEVMKVLRAKRQAKMKKELPESMAEKEKDNEETSSEMENSSEVRLRIIFLYCNHKKSKMTITLNLQNLSEIFLGDT